MGIIKALHDAYIQKQDDSMKINEVMAEGSESGAKILYTGKDKSGTVTITHEPAFDRAYSYCVRFNGKLVLQMRSLEMAVYGLTHSHFDTFRPDLQPNPKTALQQGVAEGELEEGWKNWVAGAALGAAALGGAGHAQAADLSNYNTQYLQQVASGQQPRPMVSVDDAKAELQARADGKQQATAPQQKAPSNGFSKEYLQSVVNGTHPRPMISVEKAQQLLNQMDEGVAEGSYDNDPGINHTRGSLVAKLEALPKGNDDFEWNRIQAIHHLKQGNMLRAKYYMSLMKRVDRK
jgi:hypothetical protein